MKHTGHCLCGAVQFASSVDPVDVGYCHCKMCQMSSGAPVLPWASFDVKHFSYLKEKPQVFRSSKHGQREFCAGCGSQIAFRQVDRASTVEINIGALDDPEKVAPRYHIWCDSRISWFDTVDDLPRHPGAAPNGDGT